jgi:hypothetical protein
MKRVFVLAVNFVLLTAHFSWAGPLVFGPQRFTQPSEVTFAIANPAGTYWLQVSNGEGVPRVGARPGIVDMQNLVTSGTIVLNGVLVATVSDFDHNVTLQFGFQKDLTLNPGNNTLRVELQGPAGSFITVSVREADPNPGVINPKGDLWGSNLADQIALWWVEQDGATEYVIFRSLSFTGPWQEIQRVPAAGSTNTTDTTPDARLKDLCYRADAFDSKSNVIRRYAPICVPRFVEK